MPQPEAVLQVLIREVCRPHTHDPRERTPHGPEGEAIIPCVNRQVDAAKRTLLPPIFDTRREHDLERPERRRLSWPFRAGGPTVGMNPPRAPAEVDQISDVQLDHLLDS